jgi:hypothetical protein
VKLQKQRGWGGTIIERESAVCLFAGLGNPIYLTRDGRMLVGPCWPDDPPELRVANENEAIAGLVIGAKRFGNPELLTLLPPRPATASTCAPCTGTRWLRFNDATGNPAEIVCPECGGRGWRLDAETR